MAMVRNLTRKTNKQNTKSTILYPSIYIQNLAFTQVYIKYWVNLNEFDSFLFYSFTDVKFEHILFKGFVHNDHFDSFPESESDFFLHFVYKGWCGNMY